MFEKSDQRFISTLRNPELRRTQLRRMVRARTILFFAMLAVLAAYIVGILTRSSTTSPFTLFVLLLVIAIGAEQRIALFRIYEELSEKGSQR
jgi:hypothetical protein